jgi:LPS-assembly protein
MNCLSRTGPHLRLVCVFLGCAGLLLVGKAAHAQTTPCQVSKQFRIERLGPNHVRLIGAVDLECEQWRLFAETVDYYDDKNLLVAVDNVVFSSEGSRISADRVEFDTKTRTGTFYNASGTATLGERVNRSMFGTQEPDAYFYGQTIEKIGPQKYRITRGGFTTCVQPTPRWEVVSDSVTLHLDHYALLRHSVLKVKGVPMFYMPVFYYPIQEDDRSTGFLIPTYGASTYRGQSWSNAFFWAISRSQDATFMHDWYTQTGQGMGAEYRYISGPGSEGNARTYWLNEHEYTLPNGSLLPGKRSYQIQGGATQVLPAGLRARANVDYFSDVTVQQLYHQNIYDASNRRRTFGGNVTGAFGPYTLNGTFQRNETFYGSTGSSVHGATPRINFSRGERPIAGLPVYFTINTEYATLLQRGRQGERTTDSGLTRYHVSPLVRVPFTHWPFLTVNSSVGWFNTYWTESLDETQKQVDVATSRRYFELTSRIVGPVFNRIFDTPGSGYAEKFKHVIEPAVTFQRVTSVEHFNRIVRLESLDSVVGGSTRMTYGLTNRLYAKRRTAEGQSVSREIVNMELAQTYYTDALAAQFDRQYRTSFTGSTQVPPTKLSPISITGRVSPADEINATVRAEYDTHFMALRTIEANATIQRETLQSTLGWSQRRFVPGLPGFDDRARLPHSLNSATTIRTRGSRIGGTYAFSYDLLRDAMLQQRVIGFYNAQCCGFAVEYQTYNLGAVAPSLLIPQDRRINVSFTLAGIGSFSNFFGALGGTQGGGITRR